MKRLALIIFLSLLFPVIVFADMEKEVLACVVGFAADVDATHGYSADASEVRFLLTLNKQDNVIVGMEKTYTGKLSGYPTEPFTCTQNIPKTLYSCHNFSTTIWYHPTQRHGLDATINIVPMLKNNRANEGGIYNFNCTDF